MPTIDVLKQLLQKVTDMITEFFSGKPDDPLALIFQSEIAALTDAIRSLEWTPVTPDTMPGDAFGCLVIVEEDDYFGEPHQVIYPEFVGFDGEGWNDGAGERIPFEVTYWRPLPAAPESEDAK